MGILLLVLTNLVFPFAALGVVGGFLLSARRSLLKNLWAELKERFGLEPAGQLPQGAIWLHCASVGEVASMKQIITRLKDFYKRPILVTTSTQAGKQTALKNPDIDAAALVPLDFYPSCKRFIRLTQPYRLFVVEREIWPNLLESAFQAGVPTALLNGRISKKSTRAYSWIRPLFKRVLGHLHFAALQTREDKARYKCLGMPTRKLFVCGNVKYDALSDQPPHLDQVRQWLKSLEWEQKMIFALGSTHPQEEELLLRTAPAILQTGTKIIFAPRHLERMEEIENNLRRSGLHYALASHEPFDKNTDILCVDKMGMLSSVYACATLCFVGGSIAPRGAHNLLEPAILSKTVLFGKYFYNTPITAHALLEEGGGVLVDEENFKTKVLHLLTDKAQLENMSAKARATALSFQGATNQIMEVVKHDEQQNA